MAVSGHFHQMAVSGHFHFPAALPPRNEPYNHWRLAGLESQSGRFGEEKISSPVEIRTPDRPVCSVVEILIELSRLLTAHITLSKTVLVV